LKKILQKIGKRRNLLWPSWDIDWNVTMRWGFLIFSVYVAMVRYLTKYYVSDSVYYITLSLKNCLSFRNHWIFLNFDVFSMQVNVTNIFHHFFMHLRATRRLSRIYWPWVCKVGIPILWNRSSVKSLFELFRIKRKVSL